MIAGEAWEAVASRLDKVFATVAEAVSIAFSVIDWLAVRAVVLGGLAVALYVFFPRHIFSPEQFEIYPVRPRDCAPEKASGIITCKATAEDPISARVDPTAHEVLYLVDHSVGRWTGCTIFDRDNWECGSAVRVKNGQPVFWNYGQAFVQGYRWRLWSMGFSMKFRPDCADKIEQYWCAGQSAPAKRQDSPNIQTQ